MDVIGFILELLMGLVSFYIFIIFNGMRIKTGRFSYSILSAAFLLFTLIDLIDNVGTNLLNLKIFESLYVHEILVLMILLSLAIALKPDNKWKQPLKSND